VTIFGPLSTCPPRVIARQYGKDLENRKKGKENKGGHREKNKNINKSQTAKKCDY
jgi:hypothetical protein